MGDFAADPTGQGAERYELLIRLAVGGMAEIHLARTRGISGFEKYAVVKQLLPHPCSDDELVRLFLDEARLAAQLDHQNIGQVYDIGRIDGRYFFAMEYLHGKDAREILACVAKRGERLPLEHALTIVTNVAAALRYAHAKEGADGQPLRIVHRDVSPANIIVTYEGAVKLVDFGIARASTRSAKTQTGTVRGKINYMSPEQCLGKLVDSRSDIFALGVVLYELSTTTRLFHAKDGDVDYLIMDRIVKGEIAPPSEVVEGFPGDLEAIIMRALSREPGDRYACAEDMLMAIEGLAAKRGVPLSTTLLADYLAQLFGREPEPWRDLGGHGIDNRADTEPADDRLGAAYADEPVTSGDGVPVAVHTDKEPDRGSALGSGAVAPAPAMSEDSGERVADGAPAEAIEDRTSRRLALPLPAEQMASGDQPSSDSLSGEHEAVPRNVSVEQTLPTPPPPYEDDWVSIEVVSNDGQRGWMIAAGVLTAIAAGLVVALALLW